jgi:uncharacterized membrane protein
MAENMVEHHTSVLINAPVHQVYSLFSHFNDFPKFMSFIKEVTYYSEQHSHWVVDVAGHHEWDAVNEDWIPDRQIGWRSIHGLNNYGRVIFRPLTEHQTRVDVYLNYHPPAGLIGSIGEHLGVGRRLDEALQNDLQRFAKMVNQAPANALDPNSSQYLFHAESAAMQGTTTARQNATMSGEFVAPEYTHGQQVRHVPLSELNPAAPAAQATTPMREDTLLKRPILDQDIIEKPTDRILSEKGQAMALDSPEQPGQNHPAIPPEQLPPWQSPESNPPPP